MYTLKQPLQPAFYLNLRPKILTNYQEEALEKIFMNQEKFFNGSYFEHISLLVLIIIYLPPAIFKTTSPINVYLHSNLGAMA